MSTIVFGASLLSRYTLTMLSKLKQTKKAKKKSMYG